MSKGALITGYFVVLFFAHQDSWWKNDPRLVFGFLPVSLAFHVAWTLLVALGWVFVARYCWPERFDAEPPASGSAKKNPPSKS